MDTAMDVASILLATGRTTPAGPWIERMVRLREEHADAALPHRHSWSD